MSENRLQAEIRVGTSGYSFADWIGVFYPYHISKGKMLDHYVQHFPTVEINSTYYRIPHPAVIYNMVKKTPSHFDFMVKVPQSFTHRRTEIESDILLFRESIRPIIDSGQLAGCLAQFPYSFKRSKEALEYVARCREAVEPSKLFVEYRHSSWSSSSVVERMAAERIGYVSVDEPALSGLMDRDVHLTTDTVYVRLHGRNNDGWWVSGEQRYNYLYSEQELEEWRAKLEEIRNKVARIYVYFNNCYDGKAAINALDFMKRISTSI